jgi:hypothetical protein
MQCMDISWIEIGYHSSPRHEELLDVCRECFGQPASTSAWTPHLSLGYDQPEDTRLSWEVLNKVVAETPSLMDNRKPSRMSLCAFPVSPASRPPTLVLIPVPHPAGSTEGVMEEWERLDSISFVVDGIQAGEVPLSRHSGDSIMGSSPSDVMGVGEALSAGPRL